MAQAQISFELSCYKGLFSKIAKCVNILQNLPRMYMVKNSGYSAGNFAIFSNEQIQSNRVCCFQNVDDIFPKDLFADYF